MRVKLLPVYSRLAEEEEIPAALRARLPEGILVQESRDVE